MSEAERIIEFTGVTKHFGTIRAVDQLTATVRPGVVTGFLGPNGSGKTTTLRMLLGLTRPTAGHATIGGKPYQALLHPSRSVGAALEASFHPGRTALSHLRIQATAAGISHRGIPELLALVGLSAAAERKVGGYSLGMRQRLALATALLGDPGVIVLDEPINGLDPEGIRWIRSLLRQLADEGRTVLVSSHLLSEVRQSVDELLVISRGRSRFQGSLAELEGGGRVLVDGPDRAALERAIRSAAPEASVQPRRSGEGLEVVGLDAAGVGLAAQRAGLALSLLSAEHSDLEQVFLELVAADADAEVAA